MSDQRLDALARATEIRTLRARLKQRIGELDREAGSAKVAGLIFSPPRDLEGMPVAELLGAIRGVGKHQTHRWLMHLATTDSKRTIGSLTPRQRSVMCEVITGVPPSEDPPPVQNGRRSYSQSVSAWVDPDLALALRNRAVRNHRKPSEELREILQAVLAGEMAA